MVLDTSENDAQAEVISAINIINQISENKYLDSGAFGNYHNIYFVQVSQFEYISVGHICNDRMSINLVCPKHDAVSRFLL